MFLQGLNGQGELIGERSVESFVAPSAFRQAAFSGGKLVTTHDDFTVRVWSGPNNVATLTGVDAALEGLALEPARRSGDEGSTFDRVVVRTADALQVWSIEPPSKSQRLLFDEIERDGHRYSQSRHALPYRRALESDAHLHDASDDGKLVLECTDRPTCGTVAFRERGGGKPMAMHPGRPGHSCIASPDWVATGMPVVEKGGGREPRLAWRAAGDTVLRPARGGAMRTLAGCRAHRADQLWISADATRGVCIDDQGVAVWTDGKPPRHLFDCTRPGITSHSDAIDL